ncbi:histidine phosphotransferase [Sulfitobacter albidus]|uniref:Histidine phosphotransferase n=1 Tax=Sulfitobacter albidus TaxID=2829501 RepID=A0A975PNA6_9RHOB|nr:histidine phosphotransferase family protein [Sulfitobacter albidus]QUJ77657.1 histidine phosphotransferase [Sulfitobacter albidus]
MTQPTDFSALIGSRICHDLISPIGAINNGLELLQMSGDVTPSPEMALISESVRSASARVRFLRIAFGHAGDQMVSPSEVTSILKDIHEAGRLQVTWIPSEPETRRHVRMGFLAMMCVENAMPYGGVIDASARMIEGRADKFNLAPELWDALTGASPLPELSPAQVQFGLLRQWAEEDGRAIHLAQDANRLTLRFD